MRRAFDRSFAEPERSLAAPPVRLLAIRARDELLALRYDEIGGVLRCPKLSRVPSEAPALLGIGGVRGEIVGFYSLAALLGAPAPSAGSWAVLYGPMRSIGLVFEEVIASIEVAPENLRELVTVGEAAHAVIDLSRIAAQLGPRGA
jgi:purine-binding chemotaxis protein CheW